ncbi:hypothetical protein ACFQL4_22570 [Halosimplex aquaticum]
MTNESGDRPGARVLYVDGAAERATPVVDALREAGFTAERAPSAEAARDALATDPPACVVSEQDLPDGSGLQLLGEVREQWRRCPFSSSPPSATNTWRAPPSRRA